MTDSLPELKKFTQYVCPEGRGLGHGSLWTGALKTGRRPGDHLCYCGTPYVEEVEDGLHLLTWERVGPGETDYHPVKKEHRVLAAAEEQRNGLLALIDEGELIRNVELRSFDVVERSGGAA